MVLTALICAIAAALLVVALVRIFGPGGAMARQRSIHARIQSGSPDDTASEPTGVVKRQNFGDTAALTSLLSRYDLSREVAGILTLLKIKLSVFVVLAGCAGIGIATFFFFSSMMNVIVASAIAAAAGYTPLIFLRWLHKRYIRKFTLMLPDTLSILHRAIKAGHGIETALNVVVQSTPYPVNEEFKKAIGEMQLGLSLQNALLNLYRRMESEELKILVTGIAIQQELGGNLSEILDNLEKTMRERFALDREVKALSAQGVMAGWALAGICFLLMGFTFMSDKETFIAFLGSLTGKISLSVSLGLQAVGFFIISKMVKVKD